MPPPWFDELLQQLVGLRWNRAGIVQDARPIAARSVPAFTRDTGTTSTLNGGDVLRPSAVARKKLGLASPDVGVPSPCTISTDTGRLGESTKKKLLSAGRADRCRRGRRPACSASDTVNGLERHRPGRVRPDASPAACRARARRPRASPAASWIGVLPRLVRPAVMPTRSSPWNDERWNVDRRDRQVRRCRCRRRDTGISVRAFRQLDFFLALPAGLLEVADEHDLLARQLRSREDALREAQRGPERGGFGRHFRGADRGFEASLIGRRSNRLFRRGRRRARASPDPRRRACARPSWLPRGARSHRSP